MTDCIHGFEAGMCDICFPRLPPEPVVAAGARTAPRASTPRTRKAGPVAGVPARLAPFATRRLYHVTHARNLESILLDGEIRAAAGGADPDVDVAAPIVRELRGSTDVGDGRTVADFVPFGLSPDTGRWVELRSGASGTHWSAAARLTSPAQYVLLVAGADRIGSDVVVADGDASAPATRFTIGDPARGVARAAREDPELSTPEVLVAERVPLDALLLIGVPNEPMRTRVRGMFDAVGATPPKIVVHPPWFAPVED